MLARQDWSERLRRRVAILLTIAFLVSACGSPTPTPTPTPLPSPPPLPSLSATIPAEGITLAIPGGASVQIPAGAVPEGTTGSISAGEPSGGPTHAWPADAVGLIWTVDLGDTALAKPVTLTLPFDATLLPAGVDPAGLLLAYRDPTTGSWVPVPAAVDPLAQTVTATVDHLSAWGLFTIDWDYWVAFIKQVASGNLGDFLNAVVTVTSPCATTSPVFTLDNGGTHGMVEGCITSSTETSAEVRVTNLRAFRLKLFGSALGAANGTLLASGESVPFSLGVNDTQPVVVAADLDAMGLGYDITDIILHLLPGSDLVKDAGTYAKVLDEILTAQAQLWTSAMILDELKAGKRTSAVSRTVELLTSETYLTTLLQALQAAGKAHGIPILASLSKDGIKRVLTVVNLTDLIVTTFTFVAQYFITAHSEVSVSWLIPLARPSPPTNALLYQNFSVDCLGELGEGPLPQYCAEVGLTWESGGGVVAGYRLYGAAAGATECGATYGLIATLPATAFSYTFVEPPGGECLLLAAFNAAGESPRVGFMGTGAY